MVLYGPLSSLQDRARRFGLKLPEALGAEVVDIALGGPVALGRTSAAGGRAAALAVLRAADDAKAGRVDAIVTAPLNKESLHAAGYPWPGHTEMLAEAAGTADVAMMFVGGTLRVALLTIHRALRSVAEAVVAGYHDQGLIPVKLLAFGHAVNVTIGLPFVRTSVDHGTGFDIVEKGTADGKSLVEAMKLAVTLAGNRGQGEGPPPG